MFSSGEEKSRPDEENVSLPSTLFGFLPNSNSGLAWGNVKSMVFPGMRGDVDD